MQIKGSHIIQDQSPGNVWNYLVDPKVLSKVTPGLTELVVLEKDQFKAISEIKIGPVKGRFEGELGLTDRVETERTTVVVHQKSKIGNVSACIRVHLFPINGSTEVNYDGEAKMAGKLATMGQRIIGGVINSLSKQFFKNLENEILNDK